MSEVMRFSPGEALATRIAPCAASSYRLVHQIESSRTILLVALAFLAGLTFVAYLAFVQITLGTLGFPLDDAWIYQTFARNLARYGSFVYNPGVPAAGATSVLWVPLLALSYVFGIDPALWTYAWGTILLLGLALASYYTSLALFPGRTRVALASSLIVATDWRMTWSALSGMETTLFTLLTILFLGLAIRRANPLLTGLIGGMLVPARPEGILLLGIVYLFSLGFLTKKPLAPQIARLVWMAIGSGMVLAPYFAFNWSLTGQLMPTTYYAKQAMYATGVTLSYRLSYVIDAIRIVLLGPAANAIFAAGSALAVYKVLAAQSLPLGLPLAWGALLVSAYALRLPITFQHGRYIMPLIPIAIIYSVAGTGDLLGLARRRSFRLLTAAFPFIAGALVFSSWAIGARALAADIGAINVEHVETARWIDRNTPPESVIATHDIGAMAYFSNRRIVDTAGLIDPDFIPLVNDHNKILALARAKGADYFSFLPDWYPELQLELADKKVYEARSDYVKSLGLRDMVVYRLEQTLDEDEGDLATNSQ